MRDLAMEIGDLLKEKREDIIRIASKYGARNVRLFGSVARGEAQPESDVDLLVRLDPEMTLLRHAALARD
jgi:predicted nucleotidyltransferase